MAIVLNVGVAPSGYYEMGVVVKEGVSAHVKTGSGGGGGRITSVGQNAEVVIIN